MRPPTEGGKVVKRSGKFRAYAAKPVELTPNGAKILGTGSAVQLQVSKTIYALAPGRPGKGVTLKRADKIVKAQRATELGISPVNLTARQIKKLEKAQRRDARVSGDKV